MALVQLDVQMDLSNEELKKIHEICKVTVLFKVAVGATKDDDLLLLSEKMITFTLKKLGEQNSEIGKDLKERFRVRIDERRSYEIIRLQ